MAKGPERVANMVEVLRKWQAIERKSLDQTAEIIEQTQSPLIRIVMEIIRHDSLMHHRVQQWLIDSVTRESVAVTREDVAKVWDQIEAHDKAEHEALKHAETLAMEAWDPVHRQMLEYLLQDEKKHDGWLHALGAIKSGMSKSSGG